VLPLNVLTDLVRSYTTEVQSIVPQFLAASFEMLRDGQAKMIENLSTSPIAKIPGFEAMQAQQKAFMKAMTGGFSGNWSAPDAEGAEPEKSDLDEIRRQLAELQKKLSKLG
jgi:polyhydroxyalkanoate synthesis regulator protein